MSTTWAGSLAFAVAKYGLPLYVSGALAIVRAAPAAPAKGSSPRATTAAK